MKSFSVGKLWGPLLASVAMFCLPALAPAQITAWGDNSYDEVSEATGLTNVKQISSGGPFGLALNNDGTITQWGDTSQGETTNYPTGIGDVVQVSGGAYFALALEGNGTVVQWGDNTNNEGSVPNGLNHVISVAAGGFFSLALSDNGTITQWGDTSNSETSNYPTGITGVSAIAAGEYYAIALKSDGTVVAWGDDSFGETDVPAGLTGVKAIAAGAFHALALKSDGTVVAWGDGTAGDLTIPAGLSGVVAIAAGVNYSLALKSDGTVVAWGYNASGQATVPSGLTNVSAIAAGTATAYALSPTNTATAFGSNTYGGCNIPANLQGVKQVSAGLAAGTALLTNGTVTAWGNDVYGNDNPPPGLSHVIQVSSGAQTLALLDDGTVVAWGDNTFGEATVPSGLTGVVAVAAGSISSFALKDDGTVVAWGYNGDGETNVPGGLSGVKALSGGGLFELALLDNGMVVAWGDNSYGESTIPGGLADVKGISAGSLHALVLLSDGTVAAWGDNTYGQLNIPGGLSGVEQVSAGSGDSLALETIGGLVAWGSISFPNVSTDISAVSAGEGSFTLMLSPPIVSGVSFSPSNIVSGDNTTCTVTVSPPAPSGGATVTIVGTGLLTLPSTVFVSAGQSSASFQLSSSVQATPSLEAVTAIYDGTSANGFVTISALSIASVAFTSDSVEGGTPDTCTVTLTGVTGSLGATVNISGTGPWTLPTTLTIPAGVSSASFPVSTTAVSTSANETVTASFSGSDSQTLTSTATSGTFNLTFNGQQTSAIAFNATASQIQTDLQSLSSIGTGNVICQGGPVGTNPVVCTFVGAFANLPEPLMTVGGGNLGGGSVSIVDDVSQGASFTTTPAVVESFVCTPGSVEGGTSAQFTVTLDSPAGPSGDVVSISGTGPVTLPTSVTVPSGSNAASFTATTSVVSSGDNEQVTAGFNSTSQVATLGVYPARPASLTLTPSPVTGDSNVEATIYLSGPLGSQPLTLAVSSNSSSVIVPSQVTVPAGASSYSFLVKTSAVSSSTQATVSVGIKISESKPPSPTLVTATVTVVPSLVASIVPSHTVICGSTGEAQVNLAAPAGPSGEVVNLSSNDVAVIVPGTVTVPAGASSYWFVLKTSVVLSPTLVTLTATTGSVSKTGTLTVLPITLSGISVSPSSVVGGNLVETTVTLSAPAGQYELANLYSSNSAVAPVPASVTWPTGATSYSFQLKTQGVSSSTSVTLSAVLVDTTVTANLTVTPATLNGFSLSVGSVSPGGTSEATITLNGMAGPAGDVVNLSSTSSNVILPATVTIPAGANHFSFQVRTKSVTTVGGSATLTATLGSSFSSAGLTIIPAI